MRKHVGTFVLGASLGAAALAWGPTVAERWRAFNRLSPPISIPNATAAWIDDRRFDIEAPTYFWTDTCPAVYVSWWVQTRANGSVPITTEAVVGPFKADGPRPPRYRISITPTIGPAIQLRGTIPEWLPPADVLLVGVDDTVPDNEPCASGWVGTMQVFRVQIQ